MKNDKLNIVATENQSTGATRQAKMNRREEAIAKFDRMWHTDPKQFDPQRNAMERERIERSCHLLEDVEGKKAADLGSGFGAITEFLSSHGAFVHAVDISNLALKQIKDRNLKNVTPCQDYLPNTILKDDAYDIIVSTDVVAFLNPDQYRLYISELSRLVKIEGYVLCSTPVDIDSEDAVQRFAALAETEFVVEKWTLSHHAYYIRLLRLLTAPERFSKSWRDPEYKHKMLQQGNNHWWFKLNTKPVPAAIWTGIAVICRPLVSYLNQSRSILLGLEKLCRFLCNETGINHMIFVGKRRPLIEVPSEEQMPQERKHKREVWE